MIGGRGLLPLLVALAAGALGLAAGVASRAPALSLPSVPVASGEAVGEACALAGGRRIRLEVLRGCLAAWEGESPIALDPGSLELSAPARVGSELVLRCRLPEGDQRRSWAWERLMDRATRRGMEAGGLELEPARRGEHAAAWRDLRGWLPELLAGGSSLEVRRDLSRSWERWAAWRDWLGSHQDGASLQEWDSGLRLLGPAGAASGKPVELEVEGSEAPGTPGRGYTLVLAEAKVSPVEAVARAARSLRFAWPEVGGQGPWLRLALRVRRIPEGTRLVFELADGERVVSFWNPSEAKRQAAWGEGEARWMTARLPRDLAPVPGTLVRITLRPEHRRTLSTARLVGVWVEAEVEDL